MGRDAALRIKRAGGLERGSDDKKAACKIAWYALRYHHQAKLCKPCDTSLEKIKHLITQRERIVTSIKQLRVPAEELKQCGSTEEAKMIEKLQQPAIKALQKTKQGIEALIAKTVKQDEKLHHTVERVQSVHGIGSVTAVALLVYTKGFTAFGSAKELACYSVVWCPSTKRREAVCAISHR